MGRFFAAGGVIDEVPAAIRAIDRPFGIVNMQINLRMPQRPTTAITGDIVVVYIKCFGGLHAKKRNYLPRKVNRANRAAMFGKNPIRPPEKGDGSTLLVQEIFPTLQGEGPLAGVPAIFLRLGGCNLACSFCDTEFESFKELTLEEVLAQVLGFRFQVPALKPKTLHLKPLVVITGGEPLRQPIEKLCERLIAEGFTVQIETNGTLWRKLPEAVRVVVSPKNTGIGYQPLRPDVAARAEAIKFIISASDPLYQTIADIGIAGTPIYVQPMDEGNKAKNAANLKRCLEISNETGARLSLQLHKIMGIP